jgi:putative tricarboxylic transport membrane protein
MSEPEPQNLLPHEEPLPPRVDLWTAAVFLAVGVAIVYASWLMPTFREQQGQIYKAPGLVPALYGIVVVLLALWLAARSVGRGALQRGRAGPRPRREGYSNLRLALAAGLGLAYAVGMLGRLPFWLATAIFIFLFVLVFEWQRGRPWRGGWRPAATAALLALGAGWAVLLVFRDIFLVRLP